MPPSELRPNNTLEPRTSVALSTAAMGKRWKFTSCASASLTRTPFKKTLIPWGVPTIPETVKPRIWISGWRGAPWSLKDVTPGSRNKASGTPDGPGIVERSSGSTSAGTRSSTAESRVAVTTTAESSKRRKESARAFSALSALAWSTRRIESARVVSTCCA